MLQLHESLPGLAQGARPSLLTVDDDPVFQEILATYLRSEGFDVRTAATGRQALDLLLADPVDLLLLDVRLPGLSGFELVRRVRELQDTAVIYVTASEIPEHRIHALESGGDDYLNKPIQLRELLARIRAVLRRHGAAGQQIRAPQTVLELDGWLLDIVRRELADPDGQVVPLTRAEFDLLAALALSPGRVLGREYLLEVVASAEATCQLRLIDVMVSKIRSKLARCTQPAPGIATVTGQGYRFRHSSTRSMPP